MTPSSSYLEAKTCRLLYQTHLICFLVYELEDQSQDGLNKVSREADVGRLAVTPFLPSFLPLHFPSSHHPVIFPSTCLWRKFSQNHEVESFFYFKPSPLSCLPFLPPPFPPTFLPMTYLLLFRNWSHWTRPSTSCYSPTFPGAISLPFLPSLSGCFLSWGQDLCSGSQPLLLSLESHAITWLLSPVYSTLAWIWILPIYI